jgi:hypothetical protein
MLVDSNKVIYIASSFLTELDTVYPEQLLSVYQLDSPKNLLDSLTAMVLAGTKNSCPI